MGKKTYYTIIALILAAIFTTMGVFAIQTNLLDRGISAVLITKSQEKGFEFWELVRKGAQEASKEFNVTLSIDGPMTEEDVAGQIACVERAIAQKPDAILLAAADRDLLLPYAKEIKASGIKLVLVDSGLSETVEDCFVGTDNYAAAQAVGDAMGEAMGGLGKVGVIAHQASASTSVQRIEGFEYAIRNYPEIEIVQKYDIGDSVQKSYETTLRLLREHPDIKGIFATNQISAEGVTQALEEAGKGDIRFFAFDSSSVQNEALEQGVVDGFAVQMAFNMGYMGVKSAVEACTGKLRTTNVDTGFAFATKENMGEPRIQKLIYPFV